MKTLKKSLIILALTVSLASTSSARSLHMYDGDGFYKGPIIDNGTSLDFYTNDGMYDGSLKW